MPNKKLLIFVFGSFRGYPQGVFITSMYLIAWKLILESTWEQPCNNYHCLRFPMAVRWCSYSIYVRNWNWIKPRNASQQTSLQTYPCMHVMHVYIYTHIHIHINSTRYINRSRYTFTSLHMSYLCKIPKDLFTQIFDVFFPGWNPFGTHLLQGFKLRT